MPFKLKTKAIKKGKQTKPQGASVDKMLMPDWGGVFLTPLFRSWVRTQRAPFSVFFLMPRLARRVGKKEIGTVESFG